MQNHLLFKISALGYSLKCIWQIFFLFARSLKSWNDVTIIPSVLFLASRFCTPPEVKFDAFGTSKHRYRKFFFAILISTLRRFNRENKNKKIGKLHWPRHSHKIYSYTKKCICEQNFFSLVLFYTTRISFNRKTYNNMCFWESTPLYYTWADLGGGCRECAPPPLPRDDLWLSNTTGVLRPFTSQLRHSSVVHGSTPVTNVFIYFLCCFSW